jgi:hypothetical protein
MPGKKRKRMKAWKGWCVIDKKTGALWYYGVDWNRDEALQAHWQAMDGSGRFTRIAHVQVTELRGRRR